MQVQPVGPLSVVVVGKRYDVGQAVLYEPDVCYQPLARDLRRFFRDCPLRVVLDTSPFAELQLSSVLRLPKCLAI